MEKYTVDAIPGYELLLTQPAKGYRFSTDSLLLADFVVQTRPTPTPPSNRIFEITDPPKHDQALQTILDIGTGCGILAILLAHRLPHYRAIGIEVQDRLARLAQKNIGINRLSDRVTIIHRDIIEFCTSDPSFKVGTIVSNPPYKKTGSGRLNPDPEKAIARHEIRLTIETVCRAAQQLLIDHGSFFLVYPSERIQELLVWLSRCDLHVHAMRFVYTQQDGPAMRVLIHAVKNGSKDCVVSPPIRLDSGSAQ